MGSDIDNEMDDVNEFEALPELPPADFDFLIYSLRLQTELSLGLLPCSPPGEDGTGLDLGLARHNIDLLAMLQCKTKGNLTAEEQRALDNSVSELRFHFTQIQQEALNPA
jgi:hypothetical protein